MGQRANRLHRGAKHDRLGVAHAGLQPAGMVARPGKAERGRADLRRIVADRVVDLEAGKPRRLKPHADLDAFDRLHGHDRLGEPAIELLVPLGVRAEAKGDALDADFDDPAERVAGPLDLIDHRLEFVVLVGVQGVKEALVAKGLLLAKCAGLRLDVDGSEGGDVAKGRDAQRGEQLLRQGPGGDAGGRFPGAGPLQDRTNRTEVLDRSAQIAVSRARGRQIVHAVDFVVLVGDEQGDWAAQGHAPPDAAEDIGPVAFQPLPPAAAVASLTAVEFGVDQFGLEFHARRKTVHQREDGLSVGLACGEVSQHISNVWFTSLPSGTVRRPSFPSIRFYPDHPDGNRALCPARSIAWWNGESDRGEGPRHNRVSD